MEDGVGRKQLNSADVELKQGARKSNTASRNVFCAVSTGSRIVRRAGGNRNSHLQCFAPLLEFGIRQSLLKTPSALNLPMYQSPANL